MPIPRGYNPLNWDCKDKGCFNIEVRPKIELFADCFPRACNFGDIDGLVEINGFIAILEWKGGDVPIPKGQLWTYEVLTKQQVGNVVFMVWGCPKTMSVRRYAVMWSGKDSGHIESDLEGLKTRIKQWVSWTNGPPE